MSPFGRPVPMLLAIFGVADCAAGSGYSLGPGGSGGGMGLGGYASSTGTLSMSTTTAVSGQGVGSRCGPDASCRAPLQCALETNYDPVFRGGPAGGMCTNVCKLDSDCPFPASVCYQPGGSSLGRCVLSCVLGASADGGADAASLSLPELIDRSLNPDKCLGRDDLRCADITIGGPAACLPTCTSDTECSTRRCDPRLAVCVDRDSVSTGAPTGQACDPTAATDPCAGTCIGFLTLADGILLVSVCPRSCRLVRWTRAWVLRVPPGDQCPWGRRLLHPSL